VDGYFGSRVDPESMRGVSICEMGVGFLVGGGVAK
jgi:hypothetical protein